MSFDLLGLLAAAGAIASLVVSLLVLRLVLLAAAREDHSIDQLVHLEREMGDRLGRIRLEMEERLGGLTTIIAREQGEARLALSAALREMSEQSAARLSAIQASVNEQLHAAVEKQMQTSFQRVLEQFASVQKAMGEVGAMTAQIGDLKRLFSNVKTRGGWGEAQLRAILDDVLPAGAYETNRKLSDTSSEVVEFAVRMPMRSTGGGSRGAGARGDGPPVLAIDSKFPTEAYERLLAAVDAVDPEAERGARRNLEASIRLEARKIAAKYILPPVTVEFAVLYLPTDGLYAEVARIPGLVDEIGRTSHVLIMGPSLIPALLRTIHLGYVTLSLEEKAETISHLLGATRQEMIRMDQVLERLGRNAASMANVIEEARRRTRVVGRRLREVEVVDPEAAALLLELDPDPEELSPN
ncbi:DNA recombination protein RmuC [Lichenicola sp.]|uniref:DNA recombination protein RmuC n=1 Tax=Lichenicola sp. TaxID=2804529 RepID=UPI003B00849E